MRTHIFAAITLLCLTISIHAQNKKALALYNKAVEQYNTNEYVKADTLFSESLRLEENVDAYFARALCRGKMADRNGYCKDLAHASANGKEEATKLFLKGCGKIDTAFTKLDQKFTKTVILSRTLRYKVGMDTSMAFTQQYASQQSDSMAHSVPAAQVHTMVEAPPEFRGGFNEMMKFIQMNTVMPKDIRESAKVLLKFVVYEDGTLHDITILKSAPNCSGCDVESTRVVAIMPRWKPAYFNGQAVKSYFNLPFHFTIQ